MGEYDSLAGLGEIDWASLDHAYGSAEDVPGLLRALRSESADERGKTLYELYGNIFHQGSRYEATRYAVPFLARLATDPQTPRRADIVHLLAALAIGYDEAYLPGGLDIAGWRAEIERMRSLEPEQVQRQLDEWVEAAESEGERRVRDMHRATYDHDRERRSALDELAAYDAVRARLPELRALLGDDDPQTRAATAYLLAWFPEEATGSTTALRTLLSSESVAGVTANAIISLGLLSAPNPTVGAGTGTAVNAGGGAAGGGGGGYTDTVSLLREHLAGAEPLLSRSAAIALAWLDVVEPEVIGQLAATSADPPPAYEGGDGLEVGFMDGDLRALASQTLALLGGRLPASAVDAVLEGLSRSSEVAAFAITAAALRLTFPGGAPRPLPPLEKLTGPQQRAVRILAELTPETWRWSNFTSIVGAYNLPCSHAECRTYAGLEPTASP